MDRRFGVVRSAVVSEIIDGEAIMMHQETGDYFSADGTGCVIWQWVGEGRSRNQILELLLGRYEGGADEIGRSLDAFLDDLLAHRLVHELGEGETAETAAAAEPAGRSEKFVAPLLNVYTDMRDLLLLDPIHEVEEESGWPMPKRAAGEP